MKKDDHFNILLGQTQSNLEKRLLEHLYPRLKEDHAHQLDAQYEIDFEDDWVSSAQYTKPDFAFPDMQIAIYCDGYEVHKEEDPFWIDRSQSRRLQLKDWIVLRFAEKEISDYIEIVLQMIQQAIGKSEQQQKEQQRRNDQQKGHKNTIDAHEATIDGQQNTIDAQTATIDKQKGTISVLRRWLYATAVLGVGLLTAVVLLSISEPPAPVPRKPPIGSTVLIPAGEFQMGSDASDAESDEKPKHPVYVDAFHIDRYEVTNVQYKRFVDANPQWQKDRIPRKFHNGEYLNLWQGNAYPPGKGDHPVVYVSWYAAMAYAKWEGKRLPTEAEWEKAARGGLVDMGYTWGNRADVSKANYGGQIGDTTPVGSYPDNDYGLYDMVGNVMEWCLDAYETEFYARSPRLNPIAGGVLTDIVNNFQGVVSRRAIRSGCWYNVPLHVRVTDRYGTTPDHASKGRGFRCVQNAR